MIIIGERINATRKSIGEAIVKKDSKFIQQEALNQVNAGANLLDLNCGMSVKNEMSDMEWLVNIVQEVTDISLVIDSPNYEVIESGLKLCKKKAMVNSITGEKERIKMILPMVKKYDTDVVALTMDEKGMPHTSQERLSIAESIINVAKEYNISADRIYFDALTRPVSTEPDQTIEFLEAIKLIKSKLGAKTVCGLSNISFGLPNRKLLNSTFLAMALYAGLDAAIIDPTDRLMMTTLRASEALLGKDEYCLNYITDFKKEKAT
ncbi:MAG: methyltetrahydrofolate cobalamin methyltransferase [Elusimicrobia bacterium]|nr:methyltetrahydrofolate cobalamin methyltransferase [Elusimicrobiota bacterium]